MVDRALRWVGMLLVFVGMLFAQQGAGVPRTAADLVRELRAAPVAAAPADGRRVRIVDADGKPVANALVAARPDRAAADAGETGRRLAAMLGRERGELRGVCALMTLLAPHYRTDDEGFVTVPATGATDFLAIALDDPVSRAGQPGPPRDRASGTTCRLDRCCAETCEVGISSVTRLSAAA